MDAKKITLDGVDIEPQDVHSITFGSVVPERNGGYPGDMAKAVQIIIEREATRVPMGLGFRLATNETGKKYLWSGEIQLQDGAENITYTLKMNQAFLERYTIVNSGQDAPVIETFVIRSGDIQITAGSENAVYKMSMFK